MNTNNPLKVMVLAGGPDKERPVSLQSGAAVADALREAGHEVKQHDITDKDTSALRTFAQWDGDVIMPMLHGPWGEGGPLQRLLDDAGVCYVGSQAEAAALCIDKVRTKQMLASVGLPTPEYEVIKRGQTPLLELPAVVKAVSEGSSFDLEICHDNTDLHAAIESLFARHRTLLVEQFIEGMEITVGIVGDEVLPAIHIVPASAFYDYEAKYTREDTQYLFDIALPDDVLATIAQQAKQAHEALGCRHLSRVDFMVDAQGRPTILEVNTLPGFTSHSLLPKAAARMGMGLPVLCDRLVQMAMGLIKEAPRGRGG